MFFGDVASDATLSRAAKDGRIRRLARGLYSLTGALTPPSSWRATAG
ncbi:hypothetical protein BH24ACT3_BH24ACT3_04660 [soil metagenome]